MTKSAFDIIKKGKSTSQNIAKNVTEGIIDGAKGTANMIGKGAKETVCFIGKGAKGTVSMVSSGAVILGDGAKKSAKILASVGKFLIRS